MSIEEVLYSFQRERGIIESRVQSKHKLFLYYEDYHIYRFNGKVMVRYIEKSQKKTKKKARHLKDFPIDHFPDMIDQLLRVDND